MRTLCWFSCGAPSAVAAKLTLEKYPDAEVLYCDTLKYEHPDNRRFLSDVERWLGRPIKLLRSDEYVDIYDVFDRTGWLVGPGGARCTTELKKNVRKEYQRLDDRNIFGFTVEEGKRIERFRRENFEIIAEFPLFDQGLTKRDCLLRLKKENIEIPMLYKLGYKNNNCIGCVKGGAGYWNKIRVDFPEAFSKMALQERKMDVAINKRYEKGKRIRVFLDELDPTAGRYEIEPDIECGVLCISSAEEDDSVAS